MQVELNMNADFMQPTKTYINKTKKVFYHLKLKSTVSK